MKRKRGQDRGTANWTWASQQMVRSCNRVIWPNSKRNWERSRFWEFKLTPSVLKPFCSYWFTQICQNLRLLLTLCESQSCVWSKKVLLKKTNQLNVCIWWDKYSYRTMWTFPNSLCMTVLEVRNHSILKAETVTCKINQSWFVLANDMSCKNVSLGVHSHPLQAVQSSGLDGWTASWNSTSSKCSC